MFSFTRSLTAVYRAVLAVAVLFALAVAPATVFADGGGNVMPPTAKPHGYSLEDLNEILAKFDASYNDMRYYPPPPFPFQVLYMVSDAIQWQPTSCPDGGAG